MTSEIWKYENAEYKESKISLNKFWKEEYKKGFQESEFLEYMGHGGWGVKHQKFNVKKPGKWIIWTLQTITVGECEMYATTLVQLWDLVAPLVSILFTSMRESKFIQLHFRNSKHFSFQELFKNKGVMIENI